MLIRLFTAVLASVLGVCAPPAHATKEHGRDVATGISVLGGVGIVFPLTFVAGASAGVAQGVGLVGMGVWDAYFAAPLRIDPNHGLLATATPAVFTPFPESGPVFDAANLSLVEAGNVIDATRLLDISLRRYYGALSDGNTANAAFQRRAASMFLFQLEDHLLAYRRSLVELSAQVRSTPFAELTATVADVLTLRDQIISSGFPTYEAFVFDQMNATPQEMAAAVGEVALVTARPLSMRTWPAT